MVGDRNIKKKVIRAKTYEQTLEESLEKYSREQAVVDILVKYEGITIGQENIRTIAAQIAQSLPDRKSSDPSRSSDTGPL